MFISIFVSYYLVFVYLWSSVRDDRRKHRTEGRIFDADWQEIHSRQRKSESGPGRNLKVAPRNIVWRAEEIQVWREIWLALIFVCRVFKYRYSKYSDQGEGRKGCMCVKGLLLLFYPHHHFQLSRIEKSTGGAIRSYHIFERFLPILPKQNTALLSHVSMS